MIEFGERLPSLRRQLAGDLKREGLPREKILATVVSLLAETLVRVGNARYSIENGSFGLTTLRTRHLQILRGHALFRFRGKSRQKHEVVVDDARLVRLLRRCQQLPGQLLFQFVAENGPPQPIDSGMVNDYLRTSMGAEFSARNFRTWGATRHALAILAPIDRPDLGEREEAAILNNAIAEVAKALRNTPACAEAPIIHPAVLEGWKDGSCRKFHSKISPIRETGESCLNLPAPRGDATRAQALRQR